MIKRTKQIGIRLTDEEWDRLVKIQDNIALVSRGQRPEIVEIVRSILGLGNKGLVSPEERAFLAGEISSLHGPHGPNKRNKA